MMTERKMVTMKTVKVPFTKIFHNRTITEALAELKAWRAKFAEDEILYKARIRMYYQYGESAAIIERPETDSELEKRLDIERAKREAKLERQRKKELREKVKAEQAAREAELAAKKQKEQELATFKALYKKLGLTAKDLESI